MGANGGIIIGASAAASVGVTKVWSGDSEQDRPGSIKVDLLSNGTVIDTAVLTAADSGTIPLRICQPRIGTAKLIHILYLRHLFLVILRR